MGATCVQRASTPAARAAAAIGLISSEPELEPLPERQMYFSRAPGHLSVPDLDTSLSPAYTARRPSAPVSIQQRSLHSPL